MQFTKGVKDKILEIVMSNLQHNGYDVLRKSICKLTEKGYSIETQRPSFNKKTGRMKFLSAPKGGKKLIYILIYGRSRVKYWLVLPRDIAEKVLILNYLPDLNISISE